MKLESLKSSKFEAFKGNVLTNSNSIYGGGVFRTKGGGSKDWNDCWDDSTGKDVKTTDLSGKNPDSYDACPTEVVTKIESELGIELETIDLSSFGRTSIDAL